MPAARLRPMALSTSADARIGDPALADHQPNGTLLDGRTRCEQHLHFGATLKVDPQLDAIDRHGHTTGDQQRDRQASGDLSLSDEVDMCTRGHEFEGHRVTPKVGS